ncbi:MAG: hypothetical protein KBD52_03545 [Candidatus Pacebacteria bacterium]|nr:hypothetical protein [Candidatus Paceibacterota bacterium]
MKNLKVFCVSTLCSLLISSSVFSTEDDNKKVNGTNLSTGIKYALKSISSNCFLDGRASGGQEALLNSTADLNNGYIQWVIKASPNNTYVLKSISSNCFLDGRASGGQEALLNSTADLNNGYIQWVIKASPNNTYALKSISSNCFLDGRASGGQEALLNSTVDLNNGYIQWNFIPTSYKLKAVMSDFEYLTNVEDVLNRNKKSDFIGEYQISVGKDTVGSNISRTFQKTISDSFSWGLNQNISSETSLEINAGIPLIGGAKTTVSMSASFGSNQDWSSGKDVTFSATDVLIPEVPGLYKMSGWVETAENVELPFKSRIVLTATGDKLSKDGTIKKDATLGKEAIEYLLKFEDFNGTIITRNAYSIVASIEGTMRGSYGMSTFTKTEKIG